MFWVCMHIIYCWKRNFNLIEEDDEVDNDSALNPIEEDNEVEDDSALFIKLCAINYFHSPKSMFGYIGMPNTNGNTFLS